MKLTRGDRWALAAFAYSVGYFLLLKGSGCPLQSGPLAFVNGCQNFGIDWNRFMAPLGLPVILLLPLACGYALWRLGALIWNALTRACLASLPPTAIVSLKRLCRGLGLGLLAAGSLASLITGTPWGFILGVALNEIIRRRLSARRSQ